MVENHVDFPTRHGNISSAFLSHSPSCPGSEAVGAGRGGVGGKMEGKDKDLSQVAELKRSLHSPACPPSHSSTHVF